MPVQLQLGKEQVLIHDQFKAPSIRRHQCQCLDFWFEIGQQVSRQTDGSVGIVSNSTVNNLYFKQHTGKVLVCATIELTDQDLRSWGDDVEVLADA